VEQGFYVKSHMEPFHQSVDLMKAYDSLDWEYILHCLHCFGAPARFIVWIRACITSPSFTIALNGTLVGHFSGRNGLR
jgi:hypothetical protein